MFSNTKINARLWHESSKATEQPQVSSFEQRAVLGSSQDASVCDLPAFVCFQDSAIRVSLKCGTKVSHRATKVIINNKTKQL